MLTAQVKLPFSIYVSTYKNKKDGATVEEGKQNENYLAKWEQAERGRTEVKK